MMKQKQPLTAWVLVLTLLAFSSPTVLGQQPQRNTIGESASVTSPQTTRLRPIRIEVPEGAEVTIAAASSLADSVSYRSGDKLVVVVPQATVASVQSDVRGRGFTSMQIEQRGEDVVVSFRLLQGSTARVDQKPNGLAVIFASPEVAVLSTGSNSSDSRPISDSPAVLSPPARTASPAATSPAASMTGASMGSPTVSSPRPTQSPSPGLGSNPGLTALLNNLFPGASNNVTANTSNIDLSVPESPAFTVLGVTPSSVVRPGTPRELATSLLNGLDQNGNFQTGLAIDTAPFLLFNGQNVTLQDYNDYYMTRLLSRTQFSFASTKGASQADTSTRLALGLNMTLLDKGDARVYHPKRGAEGDVLTCFAASIKPPPPPSSANPSQAEIDQINASTKALNDKQADICRDKARKANWNRTSWVIAYAPSWVSKNGQNSNFRWNGGAFWTSFAYGFEGFPSLAKIGQLILNARYRTREQVADPANAGKFLTQNTTFFGGRLRAGNPSFSFNIEDSYIRNSPIGGKPTSFNRFGIGAEARISDNLYFVISGGSNMGDNSGNKKGFMMSSFKYGFNKKSQFEPK